MSAPAFPRFLELPVELQTEVWRYAATPLGPLELDTNALFIDLGSMNKPWLSGVETLPQVLRKILVGAVSLPRNSAPIQIYPALVTSFDRSNLKNTCRLSRIAVLWAWKKDIQAIVVQQPNELPRWEYSEAVRGREIRLFHRARLLQLLEIVIRAAEQGVVYDLEGVVEHF